MNSAIKFLKAHKLEFLVLALILILASFLRLYKIHEFVIFLGDEGRDALVVKRMIVDKDLTLLGPTASVGGFYLGPVYYYMMIPAMILSGLDPVGPAVMIALMGIATVLILYYVARDWFGAFPATIVALLYTVSPGIVNFSRSSWNPNPMPLFSLLSVVFLHYGLIKNKKLFLFLSAICLGIAIQLHYLGLLLGPILIVMVLIQSPPKRWLSVAFIKILGFLVGASLYLAFELRHNFPNIRSVIEFISRGGKTTGPRSLDFAWLFYEINRFNLESIITINLSILTPMLSYLLIGSVLAYFIYLRRHRLTLNSGAVTALIFWIIGTLGLGMYKGHLHYHYFELLFPAPFLVLAMIISALRSKLSRIIVVVMVLASSVFLVINQSIWAQGSNLIEQTTRIADQVIEMIDGESYNFALITPGNSDHAYRFFLEIKKHPPTPLEQKITSNLMVVCEDKPENCHPLGHPLWEIAGFGRSEIVDKVIIDPGITIFRLEHHQDSLDRIGQPAF